MLLFENTDRIPCLWLRFIIVALGHPIIILSYYFVWGYCHFVLSLDFGFCGLYEYFVPHILYSFVIYYLWLKLQITILKMFKNFNSASLIKFNLSFGLWISIPCLLTTGIVMLVYPNNLAAIVYLFMLFAALACVSIIMFMALIFSFCAVYYDKK